MKKCGLGLLSLLLILKLLVFSQSPNKKEIDTSDIKSAEAIFGLNFNEAEREMMLDSLKRNLQAFVELRNVSLSNSIPPALIFNPLPAQGIRLEALKQPYSYPIDTSIQVPEKFENLAFFPLPALAQLIRQKKITSVQLTQLYLERLKKYGPELECVITLTEDLALKQAQRADEEIAQGHYRGPLHGIPWGAKDLLATAGIKTSWGAMPYKDQVPDEDATVVKKLEEAGAVLVAKLTLGALAMGDVWYEGKTRNPWNLEQGSSGSSAGSAAAAVAGLVGFTIGTETLGSIISPATRCGAVGLRPSFGRVSRAGAMALSWSMDKIGPICRTAEGCALVFNAIIGTDGKDLSLRDYPFNWDPGLDLKHIRIGYLKKAFDRKYRSQANDLAVLETLKSLGVELVEIELPHLPVSAMRFILTCEAAAAFDELTRSNEDDLLVRQGKSAWPNSFRQARMIPAVEYIQANRLRTILIQAMAEVFHDIDVYIAPSFGGSNLLATNLTGHPAVVVPNGFNNRGSPTSISFIGSLFGEAKTLRVAKAYQDATDFHRQRPDLDKNIAAWKSKEKK